MLKDEALANARLIAAAPELLARLREVVSLFDDPCPYDSATTLAAARAAIAKAEGSHELRGNPSL